MKMKWYGEWLIFLLFLKCISVSLRSDIVNKDISLFYIEKSLKKTSQVTQFQMLIQLQLKFKDVQFEKSLEVKVQKKSKYLL